MTTAPDLSGDLDLDHARVSAIELARELARVHSFANRELSDINITRELDLDIDLVRDLARDLARDLDIDLVRDLVRDLPGRNLDRLVRARAGALSQDLRAAAATDLGRTLNLGRAAWRAATLEQILMAVETAASSDRSASAAAVRVGSVRIAGSVAAAAARVLPPGHRCRYLEEYRSELHELAADGTPRWRQVLYALRLLDRAWVLRAELRAPAAERTRP